MKKLFIILFALTLTSCGWGGIRATIKFDPIQQMAIYEGPKDVDLTMKRKDGTEVIYSGKTAPWWHGLLPVLIGKTPDVTVVQ